MEIKGPQVAPPSAQAPGMLAFGGLLGALVASSCCILPITLFSLGVSGAWIGNFTQLAPYKTYVIAATVGSLGAGYWLAHRAERRCADGETCVRPLQSRLLKTTFAIATALAIAAFAFDYVAPYFLN